MFDELRNHIPTPCKPYCVVGRTFFSEALVVSTPLSCYTRWFSRMLHSTKTIEALLRLRKERFWMVLTSRHIRAYCS